MKLRWKVRTWMAVVATVAGLIALDIRRSREIHPPDLIDVEVVSALPGQPITRERLVRPDGCISLGRYGQLQVSGLTPREAKAKVVGHLRRYISDEALGLVQSVQDGNDHGPRLQKVSPYDTDRVSVWIVTKNDPGGMIDRTIHAIWGWNQLPWGVR